MMRRVLLVSNGQVGAEMAGPGIRYFNLARELVHSFDVTLAVPNTTDIEIDGATVARVDPANAKDLSRLALEHDAVFAQRLPIRTMLHLARTPVRVVYDLYDPLLIETLAGSGRAQEDGGIQLAAPTRGLLVRYEHLIQEVVLATGDAFVCASERQRDLWLGWLAAAGRLHPHEYARDPTLRTLIDVVPFGIESCYPQRAPAGSALRGVLPGVTAESRVLLWGGGIWNWFDPLTVIRAVAALGERCDDVRLVFMGGGRPNPADREMEMAVRARELASELGIRDRLVAFNDRWVPYEQRGGWLAEADIGLSAHFGDVETRFAFRTRILDYFWAGLPVVCTRGDVLSDLVERNELGRVVDVEDVDGWVSALETLLGDAGAYSEARERVQEIRHQFTWSTLATRLAELLAEPGREVASPRARWLDIGRELEVRARLSLEFRGLRGLAPHALNRLAQRVSTKTNRGL